jgi:hypothetical protein
MPYLMHIAFDNSRRLPRHIYYFEYAGVRFKLIQNEARNRGSASSNWGITTAPVETP